MIEHINFLFKCSTLYRRSIRTKPYESTERQDFGYGDKFVYRKQMILMCLSLNQNDLLIDF